MQPRMRRIIVVLFSATTVAAVGYAIHLSLNPDLYFFYRQEDRSRWVYDAGSVAFICGAMILESALACLALVASRPRDLWVRCAAGLLFLGPWAYFSTMFVIHMPAYTLFHHLWAGSLVLLLAVCLVGSIVWQLVRKFRGGPPNNS